MSNARISLLSLPLFTFTSVNAQSSATQADWIPLFNGRDLSGWTPKIAGYALGENFAVKSEPEECR